MTGASAIKTEDMQITRSHKLDGDRHHRLIGRLKACAVWRAVGAASAADRAAALQALIREAEEYDADAIIGLDFEMDAVNSADIGAAPLQRVSATGVAVKFAEAA